MQNVEIDFIVKDSLQALAFYQQIFAVEPVEVGDFILGQNSVIMKIYDTRFHMLDENLDFNLKAPTTDAYLPFWFNVTVPDIELVYAKALAAGAQGIQAIQEMTDMGIKNAMFKDPFGYVWLLHQVIKEVSYETRAQLLEAKGFTRIK
ncbi:putative glyoxalase superfamily protein PhnB [Acinetobacter calcoaceticus]|uniref:Putative glyoxalase superfamily protein PhnB n=1 Tax=Acinetobacter calcoaceticus TaxID=471 RepID=A0A4R1XUZ4_ACICA|nr:putative glyoxalase superfamily protein PhnB [Acinetobacter calcoaceticus]